MNRLGPTDEVPPTGDHYIDESKTLKDPIHERMARNMFEGMSKAKAWRVAKGITTIGRGDASAAASLLKNHPIIGFRVAKLQELAAKRSLDIVTVTHSYVIDGLVEVIERCMDRVEITTEKGTVVGFKFKELAAIKAFSELAGILGMKKAAVSTARTAEDMTNEELEKMIEGYIRESGRRLDPGETSEGAVRAIPEKELPLRALPEAD